MYEVTLGQREIASVAIDTYKREIFHASVLEVEAGTNGFKGGNASQGGRTYIRIQDLIGSDMQVYLTHDGDGEENGLILALKGDAELTNILEAMKFIVKVLEEQIEEGKS